MGASHPVARVLTAGGGAKNGKWSAIRSKVRVAAARTHPRKKYKQKVIHFNVDSCVYIMKCSCVCFRLSAALYLWAMGGIRVSMSPFAEAAYGAALLARMGHYELPTYVPEKYK